MAPVKSSKKRGRPSNAGRALQEDENRPEAPEPPRRKRGRPSNESRALQESENRQELAEPSRKRGRPSNAERSLRETENRLELPEPPQKRGRPSNASRPLRETENRPEPDRPVKKARVSTTAEASRPTKSARTKPTQSPRTRQSLRSASPSTSPPTSPPPFQHLQAVERGVSRQTIDSTWEPLPPAAETRAMQLLADIEKSVVQRLQDERKRTQASTAIQMVTRRLGRKIARGLPFPPGSRPQREDDFDFEKILDATRRQEALLTPALHARELLKADIRREKALLESEKTALEELERNASAEQARRKRAAKKLHPSLLNADGGEVGDDGESLNLAVAISTADFLDDDKIDEELRPIVEELQNHLESMQNNFKQVEGLVPAMEQGEAAIRSTLLNNIDPQRYEHIIMG